MVPFGLINAPTSFMNLMNSVFKDCLDYFVLIFIDEILVYSNFVEEHDRNLRIVLQQLRERKFFGKLSEF